MIYNFSMFIYLNSMEMLIFQFWFHIIHMICSCFNHRKRRTRATDKFQLCASPSLSSTITPEYSLVFWLCQSLKLNWDQYCHVCSVPSFLCVEMVVTNGKWALILIKNWTTKLVYHWTCNIRASHLTAVGGSFFSPADCP
jgi:hypothetical protein